MSTVVHGGVLYINGLPAAHSGPGGHACAPEECWVNVAGTQVKKPFISHAYSTDLTGTTGRVFYRGYPLATLASQTSQTFGDADTDGGVKSGTKLDYAMFLSASPNVTLEGNHAIRHGDNVILNATNSEITTWNQPSSGNPVTAQLLSDPIEPLEQPASLNIQLIRNPAYEFKPAHIQQSFAVQHNETGHTVYNQYGVFKNIENTFLWHGDTFREGLYTVEEFYLYGDGMARIPLGKIHTQPKNNTTPAMKLVPLAFRRYDDIQHSADGSSTLYPESFIYLFKDGYIWRVFHVNRHGRLYEIDFYESDKRIRPDTGGELKQGVLLPIEDADGKHTFSVAVSHLALSWDTLHQLGGINPTDPRFEPEHHLPISPDAEFIAKRLQKIDIAALIDQGEQQETIPLCNTQDEVMYSVHACEPPTTNMNWVVERDRLKHSTGTKKFSNHLFWHEAPEPALEHTPTLTNLAEQALACHVLPGTAVLLLDDPLGRLLNTAEMMINQHAEFGAYSDEHGEAYTLGQVVGAILDKTDAEGKDYRKHVRDDERKKHIRDYDLKQQAYTLFIREAIELLKFWYSASFERGQWEDFYRIPRTPDHIRKDGITFRNFTNIIHSAFMLHEEGIRFLAAEAVVESNNTIDQSVTFVESISKIEIVPKLINQTAALMSSILEATAESFDKILNFYENSLNVNLRIKLESFIFDDVVDHHQTAMGKSSSETSSTVRIQNGTLTNLTQPLPHQASGKMISVVTFDTIPAYEWVKAIPHSNTPIHPSRTQRAARFFKAIENNPTLKAALSVFAMFNARTMNKQLEDAIALGEVEEGEISVLKYESINSTLLSVHFASDFTAIMTKNMMRGKISSAALSVASKLNAVTIIGETIIHAYYQLKHGSSGEYALSFSHGIGSLSGLFMLAGFRAIRISVTIGRYYLIAGLVLGLISFILICIFEKNAIEKWLYNSLWGGNTRGPDSFDESMNRYYYMTTTALLKQILLRDQNGKILGPFKKELGIILFPLPPLRTSRISQLSFIIEVPTSLHPTIETRLYRPSMHGLELVHKSCLTIGGVESNGVTTTFSINVPEKILALNKSIAKIQFEVLDSRNNQLIGIDAYSITYDLGEDIYTFEKVPHEPH